MKKSNSLGGSFLSLASSKFLKYGFVLISGMLLARFRTLEEYGTYSQIMLVSNLVTSILMMGLPNSLNFFLARAETLEEKNRFVSFYYSVNTILSFLVGGLLVLSTPLMERYFKNPLLSSFVYFIAVFPWTKIIMSSVENLLVVFHKAKVLIFFRIANSGMTVLAIIFVQWMGWAFREYLILYLIVEILFTLLTYIFAIKNVGRLSFYLNRALLHKVLVFSLPLGLATAIGTLRTEMDKLFIGFVMDTERLALYTNAAKEMPVTMISASFTAILLPHIARLQKEKKTDEAVKLWNDVTILSFVINTMIACGLFVFAKEAIMFLYSEKYSEATSVFAIYSLTYIVRSTYFGMILNTGGHTKLILKSSIVSLLVNAILNILLYYSLGFNGPAIATVFSTMSGAFYLLYHTSKITGISYKSIFPWKKCGQILLVNIWLGAIFWIIRNQLHFTNKIIQIVSAIVLACIWGGITIIIFKKTISGKIRILKQIKG